MINYIEKGYRLHKLIGESGHSLHQQDGSWISSDDIAVQAIIDSFDPLPYTQAEAITAIAEHANALIEARINPLKAKRIQADALAVTAKGAKGGNLNASDNAKLNKLTAQMAYPDAIFATYDIEEAAILAATDWKAIDVSTALANLDAVT